MVSQTCLLARNYVPATHMATASFEAPSRWPNESASGGREREVFEIADEEEFSMSELENLGLAVGAEYELSSDVTEIENSRSIENELEQFQIDISTPVGSSAEVHHVGRSPDPTGPLREV